eukprot:803745-Rhodomonas_salina.1
MCKCHRALDALLQCGSLPDARDSASRTALHCAALVGDVEAVELLSKANAGLNLSSNKFQTPLHIASQEGNVKALAALIKCEAEIDVSCSLFYLGCQRSRKVTLASWQLQDMRHNTALHLAVAYG